MWIIYSDFDSILVLTIYVSLIFLLFSRSFFARCLFVFVSFPLCIELFSILALVLFYTHCTWYFLKTKRNKSPSVIVWIGWLWITICGVAHQVECQDLRSCRCRWVAIFCDSAARIDLLTASSANGYLAKTRIHVK